MTFIDDVKHEFFRLWSIRFSLMFGVFTGVSMVLAAFIDVFNPWVLLGISVVVNTALIPLSRVVKQKDLKSE